MAYQCVPSGMRENKIVCICDNEGIRFQKSYVDANVIKIAVKRPMYAITFYLPGTNVTTDIEFMDINQNAKPTEQWVEGLPNGYRSFDCTDDDGNDVVIITLD